MFIGRCRTEYNVLSPHPEKWPQLISGLGLMWRREPNFGAKSLADVTIPTTVSDGEYDEIIRRDHTERLASAIPGARLVI
jgi:pimeloyl-ACP methyl ester carboxylesterase